MKIACICLFVLVLDFCSAQEKINIVTSDIDNFWTAYDKIVATSDTLQQYEILDQYYIGKGSRGLADLMEVRNYQPKEYIDAIKNYPRFWRSIRGNTTSVKNLLPMIKSDLHKLELMYPAVKPATIYFSVGVFRTNGTIKGSNILIGSEAALADSQTVVDELPLWRQPFYKENSQRENIGLLIVHEYIHTLQNEMVHNLLSSCLYEGIAEFVSCIATGKPSVVPAIEFGKKHHDHVVEMFVKDLFIMRNNSNWLWGENSNELKVRDLGYYIGYEIAERYYHNATNKSTAVKQLIELDYHNENEVERIVDSVKLLPKPISQLYADFDKQRPRIVAIGPFENHSIDVMPGVHKLTVTFSEPLNGHHTGIDFGPKGKDHFPPVNPERIWSADKKSWTIQVDLKQNMEYQILIDNSFRNPDGLPLKPFLIEFRTKKM